MSQHIHNLMGESMKGLRDLVDVDCIVGKPIVTASGTTIIPISKVTFGFGSGGSDIAKSQKDDFGGAAGAGVTIQPLCFLIEREGDVRILNVNQNRTTADAGGHRPHLGSGVQGKSRAFCRAAGGAFCRAALKVCKEIKRSSQKAPAAQRRKT